MRRSRKLTSGSVLTISLSLLMVLVPASAGAENAHGARSATVKAVVVHSGAPTCEDFGGGWTKINNNWPSLGSIPVTVDFADPTLCDTAITYAALVASEANVVILSAPCGTTTYSQ